MIPGRLFGRGRGRAPMLASRPNLFTAQKEGGTGELETTSGRLTAQPIVVVGCLRFSAGLCGALTTNGPKVAAALGVWTRGYIVWEMITYFEDQISNNGQIVEFPTT